MLPVEQPFKTYTGLDGKPLDNGYVYFGQPGQDPIAHPVTVFWDAAGTLPAAQPLRTVNGYVMNGGTPANVFASGAFSELVQDSKGRQVFYAQTSDSFSIATVVSTFLANIAASAGSSLMGFIQSGFGAVKRTVQDVLRERVPSIENYGAVVGEDSTAAIIRALAEHDTVWVPNKLYLADTFQMASGKRLILDGTLKRIANAASDSYMITNAGGAAGDSNIIIEGQGELDGNAAAQTGDRQGLIRFQKPTDCLIDIRKAGNNKYGKDNATVSGQGCIVFTEGTRSHIRVRFLSNWQREGLFIDGASKNCSIKHVTALGDGLNSWSAVSISGTGAKNNEIVDVDAENTGATAVVHDSVNSLTHLIRVRKTQFFHGLNFGHTDKPASGSRASDIIVESAGQAASSGNHCGINVGGGTNGFDLTDYEVIGAYSHCVNISDSASNVRLGGTGRVSGALHGSGVNAFAADFTRISGLTATGNSDYGVNFNASNDCQIANSDLRGNTINAFSSTGSRVVSGGTPGNGDALIGTVNLAGIAAGGSIVVNNGNVFGFNTRIKGPAPRNATAAAAQAYIATQATGSFTITATNAVSASNGPHNVQWDIL